MADNLPRGLELTALDPVFRSDPYPRLADLRERCPVHRDDKTGAVTITRHADVCSVLGDVSLWRDSRRANPSTTVHQRAMRSSAGIDDGDVRSILVTDDPDHGRVRGLIMPVLYKRFAGARSLIEKVVERQLDRFRKEFDLVQEFCVPVPIEVIAYVLGVDEHRLAEFRAWSEAIIQTFNPRRTTEQDISMAEATKASLTYLQSLIDLRRAVPADDLVSDLVAVQKQGGDLSDAEIRVNCNTLLVAGNLTTTDLIGNGVHLLLTHPDQLTKLKANPELIGRAVEEMLRYDPPVDSTGRVASRDLEIGGCSIAKTEPIRPFLRAANRDPDVFSDPDRFDIARNPGPHVAFGGGAHACLGAPLARLEARAAIAKLFHRFPDLRLVDAESCWRALPLFRGLERMVVATS